MEGTGVAVGARVVGDAVGLGDGFAEGDLVGKGVG